MWKLAERALFGGCIYSDRPRWKRKTMFLCTTCTAMYSIVTRTQSLWVAKPKNCFQSFKHFSSCPYICSTLRRTGLRVLCISFQRYRIYPLSIIYSWLDISIRAIHFTIISNRHLSQIEMLPLLILLQLHCSCIHFKCIILYFPSEYIIASVPKSPCNCTHRDLSY